MAIDTLQQLIEKRAEDRLNADITNMRIQLRGIRLLEKSELTVVYKGANKRLGSIFQYSTDAYWTDLYVEWLPIYIKDETETFVKEFDELKEKFSRLEGQVDSLPQQY